MRLSSPSTCLPGHLVGVPCFLAKHSLSMFPSLYAVYPLSSVSTLLSSSYLSACVFVCLSVNASKTANLGACLLLCILQCSG